MHLLTEFRIFADHYQFFVYDSEAEMCPESFYAEPDDQRSDFGSYRQGYITNGKTICFGTLAHLNDYWIEVYHADLAPNFGEALGNISATSGSRRTTAPLKLFRPAPNFLTLKLFKSYSDRSSSSSSGLSFFISFWLGLCYNSCTNETN